MDKGSENSESVNEFLAVELHSSTTYLKLQNAYYYMLTAFSEELAEFVGLAFGDGSLIFRKNTDKLRFQLRGDAKSDKQHYLQFVIPLCNKLIGFPFLGKEVNLIEDRKNNAFGISIESRNIKNFFEQLEVPVGVKDELSIPQWIKQNTKYSLAFIRGLFDTDGTIGYKKNNTAKSNLHMVDRISITSTSAILINGVSEIMQKANLKHYVRNYKCKTNKKRAYVVDLYKPHVKRFMSMVGSHNPKHLTKFKIGERFGFCPPYTTLEQREQILKGFIDPLSLYKSTI